MKDRVLLKDKVVKKLLDSEHPVCREYLVRLISASTGIDANLDEETYNKIINDLKKVD